MSEASQTIVVAVDGTVAAGRAVDLLAGYRGEPDRIRIVALNVQSRPVTLWPEPSLDAGAVERALAARGREVAEPAAARLREAGLSAEAAVAVGFAAQGIVHEAQARAAGLIVMGTRGRGSLRGFAVGSIAMRVVHASAIPVCLVRPESRLPALLGRGLRVLLAVDGSEPALHAAEALASWQPWLGALDVHVACVQQPIAQLEVVLPPHDDVVRQWSAAAVAAATQPILDRLAREGIPTTVHQALGDPAAEIVRLANETGCDLVAMGTRGLGAAHHALIGSVALKVAANAPVPAVLVK